MRPEAPGPQGAGDLPPEAYALALASLPGVGPGRLRSLLGDADPQTAWRRVLDGAAPPAPGRDADHPLAGPLPGVDDAAAVLPGLEGFGGGPARPACAERLARVASGVDVAGLWRRWGTAFGVAWLGSLAYPAGLAADPEAPAVLFWRGDLAALDRPVVTVVGTRSATPTGLAVAAEVGAALAAAGVAVASGLALGVDGAAHRGALGVAGAPPVGVVPTCFDHPYPRRHRDLWAAVASRGVVLGEAPPGTEPVPWRFIARNRILAAVGHVVVVVESHASGGALSTAAQARARGRTVLAVPGSVRNPAAAGTNRLIADGCHPLLDPTDVLVALDLATAGSRPAASPTRAPGSPAGGRRGDPRPAPTERAQASPRAPAPQRGAVAAGDRRVLALLGGDPLLLDDLAERLEVGPAGLGALAASLARLQAAGHVRHDNGWWQASRG